MFRHLLLLALAAATAACAAPDTRLYRLPGSEFVLPAQTPQAVLTVKLSDRLAHRSLVYQRSDTEIHLARQHHWGEDPAPAIAKALANALNRRPGLRYTVVPQAGLPVMTVYIDAFHGQYTGHTRIGGHSHWSDRRAGRAFDVHTPQQGDGHAAMVQSLAEGLNAVAGQLAP